MNNDQKPASFVITLDDYIAEQQKSPEIADRLGGEEVQKSIGKTAEEFGLDPAALAIGIEYAILKKDMAVYLPELLRENLNIDPSTAIKVAKAAAEKIFPVFKNRLAEKEKYQELWVDIPKAPTRVDAPKGRETKGSAPVVAPTAKVAPDAPKSNFEKKAEAETVVEISKKQKERALAAPAAGGVEQSLNAKVKSIIMAANLTFADPSFAKRFETIISARIRDVRDESETKEMLARPDKVGGLSLAPEQIERVLELLRNAVAEFQSVYKKEEDKRREQFIREETEKDALRRGERDRREKEEREKLYARVTGVGPSITKASSAPRRAAILEQVRPAQLAASPATGRPKMDEVKFVPKVMGPTEELKVMSLSEFRRLSKDPKEAIEKIKDKIELLENEDFTKKVAGIKAWQDSGINNLYLQLLKEGLSKGVPVGSVVEEAIKAGKETLTKEEFSAIMELNRSLRF